ncbi:MAG: DUF1566 domain-containing protein [Bacteroidales bacterium]|nr:DUF1566 domain-containing protein [Bacteroidales bacterium]
MKTKYQSLALAGILGIAAFLTSCDGHIELPDTSVRPCHILCTDGNAVSVEEYGRSGGRAIAVVFHVNDDEDMEGYGYAVYLWDLSPSAFADTVGVAQGTSADITAYDGDGNTFAMYSSNDVSSPLAEKAFDLWAYGQSAYIPSVAQMRLLYAVKDQINPVISLCGGDVIPDEADQCWYWTSTEVEGQQTAKAWLYSMGSGAMQETPKSQEHRARAIITLRD